MEENLSGKSSENSMEEYIGSLNKAAEVELGSVDNENPDWKGTRKPKTVDDEETNGGSNFLTYGGSKIRKMYIAALAVLLNAVCVGYSATYTATATDDMQTRQGSIVNPSSTEVGWIGSFLAIGALVGGIIAGPLSELAGRKGALLISTVPFVLGWFMIAFASSVSYIYGGRVIVGFCCGIITVTAPMYLIEISTPDVRGLLGASFQLFVTIGVLIVSCLGANMSWSWSALSGAILSVLTLIAMVFIPESPRLLMAKRRETEALWTIKFLQGDFLDARSEVKTIRDDIENQPKGSFKLSELMAPEVYKPAILSFCLMIFQQCSGINAIMFYTVSIFNKAGSTLKPTTATIIVATVQVIATCISSVLMDKAGRKMLLLISGAFMSLSLITFGGFNFAAHTNNSLQANYGWLPVICVVAFITAFSLGFGPIPWLMVSEMTSARFRSATSGVATALNWMFVFIITSTYHTMETAIHDYGVFWTYAVVCIISCFFTYFFLPETKGKQIEEILSHFMSKKDDSTAMKTVVVD